jgi:hypothetical protein
VLSSQADERHIVEPTPTPCHSCADLFRNSVVAVSRAHSASGRDQAARLEEREGFFERLDYVEFISR